ncbi:MAG: ABC transporter substrate-binding protein [Bacilli bacterium]
MKRTIFTALAVLSAGAVTLSAGITPALASSAKAASKVTTIVWAAGTISQNGLRQDLVNHFEKLNPTIHVQIVAEATNTDTTRAQLTAQISGSSATPDVYDGDVIWPGQFGSEHLALPLNQHLPKSFFGRFAPGLVQGASYKGNVYGAPFYQDAGFLYYRKDLLAKAHLPVPRTWQQLMRDSLVLQHKHMVKYGFVWQGASYEGLTCDWMEYLTDAGGQVFNNAGVPAMNSPQALKALDFMRSLITSGVTPKDVITMQEPQAMTAFNAGQAAFLRNWDYAWTNSQTKGQSNVIGKVGVVPLPTFAGRSGTGYATIGGWDLYVNPHSKHLAADLAFINYITGVQGQTILATKASEIPTNAAVQRDPAIRKLNPVLSIVSQTHLIGRPSQTPKYAAVSLAIYSNINAALAGTVSPQQALKNADSQLAQAIGNSGL